MKRIAATLIALVLTTVLPATASAVTRYYAITGSTSQASNGCPIWVLLANQDDCSYSAIDPFEQATGDWVGPVFGAGFYSPGNAPLAFSQGPTLGPVTAPAPVLPLGGKTGVPVTRGFISINDANTPDVFTDDTILGTLEFGPFQRNVAVGATTRVNESFDRLIHRFVRDVTTASLISGTRNPDGSIDYVVARSNGPAANSAAAFPVFLSGSTSAAGGFSDDFPSQVASESSNVAGDEPYWGAPGNIGIARLDNTDPLTRFTATGLSSRVSVWGYSCQAAGGACALDSEINWDYPARARYDNVLLRLTVSDQSAENGGTISSATAVLVNEYNASADIAGSGNDSWEAMTASFTGSGTRLPMAFDDKEVLDLNPENLEFIIQVLANDAPGVAPAVVTIVEAPTLGRAEIVSNAISYRPDSFEVEGQDTLRYRITDANGETAEADLVLTLTDPVACSNDIASGEAGSPVTINVLANDAGYDVPPVRVTLVGAPTQGTAVVNPDNTITFTPPGSLTGTFPVTYQLQDGAGGDPVQCFATVLVDAEIAIDDSFSTEDNVPISAGVIENDVANILEAPLSIELTEPPAHGATILIPAIGQQLALVYYLPNEDFKGIDTFRYRLRDSGGFVTNEATATISVIDSVPVAVDDTREPPSIFDPPEGPPLLTAENGQRRLIDVGRNDTAVDTPYTLQIVGQPAHGTAEVVPGSTRPSIAYTSDEDYLGPDSFTYTIKDSNGDVSNVATVTISAVEDSVPVAVNDPSSGTITGDSRTEFRLNVLDNDSGLVDFPVTLAITQAPTRGVARVIPASETGTGVPNIGYRSNTGEEGADTLRYRIIDADDDLSEPGTVSIAIVDGTPTAVNDPSLQTTEGKDLGASIFNNDTGRSNFPISLSITQQPAHGRLTVRSPQSPTSLPTVTYSPDAGYTGSDTFTYRFTDGDGEQSNEATATVTIAPTPDAVPDTTADAVTIDGRFAVDEDGDIILDDEGREILDNGSFIDVTNNDTGLTDSPVKITVLQRPDPALGILDGDAAGEEIFNSQGRQLLRFASRPGVSGTATFTYRLTDDDGDTSDVETVTITIRDQEPLANFDTVGESGQILNNDFTYVVERIKTPMNVLANDTRLVNRPLRIEIVTPPAHGTVEVQKPENEFLGDQGVAYQSDEGFTGEDSFTYRVVDADGDESNVAEVRFNVLSILTANGDPTGRQPDVIPFATVRNAPVRGIDILANDGGFAYGPVTVEIVGSANGEATLNPDNTVDFVPTRDFIGAHQSPNCQLPRCVPTGGAGFRYRLRDSRNQVAEAVVLIDVFPASTTDDGGSSAIDGWLLGLLAAAAGLRARRSRRREAR